MASSGELDPSTNELVNDSLFALTLFDKVEDYHVILGNKIFRNSHVLTSGIHLFQVCCDKIDDYFLGAFQVKYSHRKKVFDHLVWQSATVLAHKMIDADFEAHVEYPLPERDDKIDDALAGLPKNVIVHVPRR